MAMKLNTLSNSTSAYESSVSGKYHQTYVVTTFSCKIVGMNDTPSAEGTQKAAINAIKEMRHLLKVRKHEISKQMLEQKAQTHLRIPTLITCAQSSPSIDKTFQKSTKDPTPKVPTAMDRDSVDFLKSMIAFLTPKIHNMEGIYRISVVETYIETVVNKFKELKYSNKLKVSSISKVLNELNIPVEIRQNVCANAFKAILRQERGLISAYLYRMYLEKIEPEKEDEVVHAMLGLFSNLNSPKMEMLMELFIHLRKVADSSTTNKMDACNLAIIFAPVILDQKNFSDRLILLQATQKLTLILECCIQKTDLSQKTHWLKGGDSAVYSGIG